MKKVGLYGGSFDPIHYGHLILAREALEQLGLDSIVFIPAAISPHKLTTPPASAEVRQAMIEAAISEEPYFSVNDCELHRDGPSYTVDTVREMLVRFPDCQLYYFIGDDNLAELHTWKEIDTLRQLVQLVIFGRGGTAAREAGIPIIERRIDISSSEIRNRIARGLSVRYFLPEKVIHVLNSHHLYRTSPSR